MKILQETRERLARLIERLVMCFSKWKHDRLYTYGAVFNHDGSFRNIARKRKGSRNVEFILWRAGQHGHKTDYWHEMGDGWELGFKPNNT